MECNIIFFTIFSSLFTSSCNPLSSFFLSWFHLWIGFGLWLVVFCLLFVSTFAFVIETLSLYLWWVGEANWNCCFVFLLIVLSFILRCCSLPPLSSAI